MCKLTSHKEEWVWFIELICEMLKLTMRIKKLKDILLIIIIVIKKNYNAYVTKNLRKPNSCEVNLTHLQ